MEALDVADPFVDEDVAGRTDVAVGELAQRTTQLRDPPPAPGARPNASPLGRDQSEANTEVRERLVECSLAPLFEEVDELLLLGDQGVDAGGLGVQVVGDRPLLGQRWQGHLMDVEVSSHVRSH